MPRAEWVKVYGTARDLLPMLVKKSSCCGGKGLRKSRLEGIYRGETYEYLFQCSDTGLGHLECWLCGAIVSRMGVLGKRAGGLRWWGWSSFWSKLRRPDFEEV